MSNSCPQNTQTLYRSRRGWFLGVCRGISEWRGISPGWLRLAFIVFFLISGWLPALLVYVVAALIMKPEPIIPITNDEEREFYASYTASRHQALLRMKRLFDELDRRTRRIETVVTSREYDWNRRMES
ncbi:PspC domain-containing protein [Rubellicoccus peritrichatus]|uniref:PspC domain-containing protein n=1 Tax=Rubellicoccus peritrichatus TaxID=3080537 RepID=A0AAQ3LE03_9BACT|nr:PspC domain-containing protein [Puniceicoccus sp. CR14]WOO42877.1 PspC domain-containing protein [Puniceicoccus sp. CR14]